MGLIELGGWMMWPLALVSVTVTAVMAERILLFSSCPFPPKDFTECLERAVEGDTARLLEALRKVPMLRRFADVMERTHPGREAALRIEGEAVIKKLEKLVSKYDAQRLQRQVYVSGRIKTMNESIYYTVDAIHNAISENKKIKFQYFQWNVKKEMELRHGGAWYHISPWGLSWDDENYYMIGYDTEAQLIKHYRVDKMLHIRMSDESREGREHFKKLDMADYAKKSFGMFRGKETSVKMLVNNSLAGVIIDRFGKDVMMIPEDEDYFRVNVDVHVSKQFLGWVFSLGEAVKIIGPDEVVEQMRGEARRLMEQYGE